MKMKSKNMLAANGVLDRVEHDFYATNPNALKCALPLLKEIGLSDYQWECACGQGHLSECLIEHGHHVYSSDIVNRGHGFGRIQYWAVGG